MALHSLLADMEIAGDVFVGGAGDDALKDLTLAWRGLRQRLTCRYVRTATFGDLSLRTIKRV